MSSDSFHLITVDYVLRITSRPIVLFPGLPSRLERPIGSGDEIELRRPDGTRTSTVIADIEHASMVDGTSRWHLRMPKSTSAADVPIGTEVWWVSGKKP